MKRIEFDTANGVYEVEDFGDDTDIIESRFVFDYLKNDFEGTCGAKVNKTVFAKIDKEYGIKHLSCYTVYMNECTGSTGTYDEWFYEDENGQTVNAVDLNEVVELVPITKIASRLGAIKTLKKAKSSQENGKLGGRPKIVKIQ